jgi:tagaturonate reductase
MLALPERAVQFGTGALLRGLVDDFIDAANRRGAFNGRVVAIGSTGSGRDRAINHQDGLYTLCVQGVRDGEPVQERRIVASVSRALSAQDEWDEVLACARSPELAVVFSNTTEIGIALDEGDRPDLSPPRSFPGKLTRFLHERARAFDFDTSRGVVVLPCELIEENGARLRSIVLALAERWGYGPAFARWIEDAVPFCNTLVDRIVPGSPPPDVEEELARSLGYDDAMLTMSEVYRLFAIEGDDALRERLGFASEEAGVVVTSDVGPLRERKVRLLNGAHTITVCLALLAGCESVRDAMTHPRVGPFLRRTLLDEIVPTVDAEGAEAFARAVLDRFANPFVRHALIDITLQGTMKMRVRIVPTIRRHVERFGHAPRSLAFGFAAFLLYMRGDAHDARRAAGLPVPADGQADAVRAHWAGVDAASPGQLAGFARRVCADVALWGEDLARVPGFADAVAEDLMRLHADGVERALDAHLAGAAR